MRSFHTLIMGRIGKLHVLQNHCRYFNKTFIEMFLEKSSINHVYLARCSYLFVEMETKMQKLKNKKLSPQTPDTICSMSPRLYKNIYQINLYRFCEN